ncbi:MAG: hypothetical protein QOH06_5617 [Acidobacteriota bacterium]|jgi:hypothetical protein|nr:hypothetical protein [Acidobacteriota bacterium]
MKIRDIAALFVLWIVAQPLLAQPANLAGHWEGAIVVSPGESEVDVITEITGDPGKETQGELWFPLQQTQRYTIQSFSREGAHLSFQVKDENGIVTSFEGEIAADGRSIAGKMVEGTSSVPFTLERRNPRPGTEVKLQDLSIDGSELRTAFNSHLGHPRIVVALSPSSLFSRTTLRLIERYVLNAIDDPNLRLFVVWEPSRSEENTEHDIQESASLITDPRVTYFLSRSGFLNGTYNALSKSTDPCLLFSSDALWGGTAPTPYRFKQSRRGGSKEKIAQETKFNAIELSFDVQALLRDAK